jgi:hypothetical protein
VIEKKLFCKRKGEKRKLSLKAAVLDKPKETE